MSGRCARRAFRSRSVLTRLGAGPRRTCSTQPSPAVGGRWPLGCPEEARFRYCLRCVPRRGAPGDFGTSPAQSAPGESCSCLSPVPASCSPRRCPCDHWGPRGPAEAGGRTPFTQAQQPASSPGSSSAGAPGGALRGGLPVHPRSAERTALGLRYGSALRGYDFGSRQASAP